MIPSYSDLHFIFIKSVSMTDGVKYLLRACQYGTLEVVMCNLQELYDFIVIIRKKNMSSNKSL